MSVKQADVTPSSAADSPADAGAAWHTPAKPRQISLRSSLIMLVLVCVLPGVALCSYLLYANYQLEKKRMVEQTELLASQISHKQMQPFVLTPPAEFADGPQLHGHPGEELVWVLSGDIEIAFPERTAQLACGDCAYFRAELPHRIRRLGDAPARVLVVIAQGEAESAKSG